MKAQYVGRCVDLFGPDIQEMVDSAVEITRTTFMRHVTAEALRSLFPDYQWGGRGFTMAKDWHICYYRGKYRGKRCWFLVHSATEYVFVRGDILGGVQ